MSRRVLTALSVGILSLAFSSCAVPRGQIRAAIWLNNAHALPQEMCTKGAPLTNYGFYRKLNSGELEFISFCSPLMADMFGAHRRDLEEMLNETLPKKQGSKFVQSVVNWHKPVEGHIPAIVQESGGQ